MKDKIETREQGRAQVFEWQVEVFGFAEGRINQHQTCCIIGGKFRYHIRSRFVGKVREIKTMENRR